MCRISYEKCVCFVFLVILAVLSCSGFRIDNLAMTDVVSSKRNSHLTSSISSFADRAFSGGDNGRHPVRHHRQSRAHQAHARHHQGLPQWGGFPTTLPAERFARPPPTDLNRPLAPTGSSGHRHTSNGNNNNRSSSKRNQACQDLVFWNKARRANMVVVANTEAISIGTNKTKHFKVVERLKNTTTDSTFPLDDQVKISDNDSYTLNTKYILFLNRNGPHNYTVVAESVKARRKYINTISTISKFNFRTRPVKVETLERYPTKTRRLKLVCRVKGLPIPCITWKRNDEDLHTNKRVRITNKNDGKDGTRRKSTLIIRNFAESDWGWYECSAQGALNSTSKRILVEATSKPSENPENGTECEDPYRKDYCLHGGTCFYEESIKVYGCRCATGFHGERCDLKMSDQPSMYPQTHLSTCKVGLYTKYDNC